ncbi:MAG: ABC-2 family transporter protein [Candidatus Liptonbacteria bacterium]|nr:ABC-2 family transporter protein [Candidatus Liptonbacteria bacterium]
MILGTSFKYLRSSLAMTRAGIASAMEYRVSFIMQVVGMILNDAALIVVWLIFFQRFPVLNGWTFQNSILLFSITTINFGLMMIFGRGITELARYISRGELDSYLVHPKSVLWQVATSRTDISAIGDTIFGLILLPFAGISTWPQVLTFALVVIFSALIFFNFLTIVQSLAFFFGHFEEAAEQTMHALLGFTLYPQSSFSGILKLITLTVLPAYFIAAVPVELVRHPEPWLLLQIFLFWLASALLARLVFRAGLRRYESGNLLSVKM